MAFTFTPNIALVKPDEAELAKNWARDGNLAAYNNAAMIDKTNIPLTAYTPTFIGSTTNPSVGAGTIKGEYQVTGGFVFGSFVIQFLDPGIGSGSGAGAYGISLPFELDNAYHTVGTSLSDSPGLLSCIGEGFIIDNTVALSGTCALDAVDLGSTAYARIITETFVGKTAKFFTPGMPMSFANQDQISGTFFYKRAT